MHKLLSLVLSVSILISSVAPVLADPSWERGARAASRFSKVNRPFARISSGATTRILSKIYRSKSPLQLQILTGHTKGIAADILKRPAAQRVALMRNEFVMLSLEEPKAVSAGQRLEAVSHYQKQLKDTHLILQGSQKADISTSATQYSAQVTRAVENVRAVLADASALGIVGTREQAPILLDFYKQAQGTVFADTATLITARGLLRMQAYDELGNLLAENAQNPVLVGVAEYIGMHHLPVDVPAGLQGLQTPAVDASMASLLETDFYPNRLHADASLQATEQWMNIGQPQIRQLSQDPAALAAQIARGVPLARTSTTTTQAQSAGMQTARTTSTTQEVITSQQVPPVTSSMHRAEQSVGQQNSARTTSTQATQSAARVPSNTSRSGILYSGLPIMSMTNGVTRLGKWIRNRFKKKARKEAPYEEPGLHENTTQPIYEEGSVPEIMRDGEDVSVVNNDIKVMVGMEGFKLTVENADGAENILHNVDLTISPKLKHFSPQYNRLALGPNGVFELRNLTREAKRPDHFYFVLSSNNGEFGILVDGAGKLGMSRPLRVKIQRNSSPRTAVTLPVYKVIEGGKLEKTQVIADVDLALLGVKKVGQAEGGQIIVHENTLYFRNAQGDVLNVLENAFIRLPKEESQYWTKILAMHPETPFSIGVFSTQNKMPPLTYLVPVLQIGLGKTLGPVLKEYSNWSETASTYTMMGINNGLTAAMIAVNPFLERFGEAKVYRLGVGALALSALGAIASGLYGHIQGVFSGPQLAAFLASSTLMALGVSVTRYLQGLLILANRGIIREGKSFVSATTGKKVDVTFNTKHLWKRTKEVFTKKSEKSLRDVLNLQRAAMYKNLGTMAFLSFPWLANLTGKLLFNVDLGLDFSASYVPYSLFSLYTLYKVYKTPFKNSFPLDITTLRNNLKDLQSKELLQVAKLGIQDISPKHSEVKRIATAVKESIGALVPVESRKTKKAPKGLTLRYEKEFLEELEQFLIKGGRSAEEAQALRQVFQKTFDELGHRNINLKDVALKVGLPPALTAMTLATIGELGFSNNFAFAMRELVGSATAATGIVGLLLYGFMFSWRVFGNFLSQRMSGGSMYAISSATAILGPLAMSIAHSNMPALMTGAVISCFGISNFFAQMYDYIIKLHPDYKREVALLINLTMPLAAVSAPLLRLAGHVPGLDMALVSAAMAGSVILTPKMLADSSIIQVLGHSWKNAKTRVTRLFQRKGNGGDEPPLIENPAQ